MPTQSSTDLLKEFAQAIEASEGIFIEDGVAKPAADPEWTDLGTLYLKVCDRLGREPLVLEERRNPKKQAQ